MVFMICVIFVLLDVLFNWIKVFGGCSSFGCDIFMMVLVIFVYRVDECLIIFS